MACAQEWKDNYIDTKLDLTDGLAYKGETQASFSDGITPLWLNANKHGLSSLDGANGYLRGALERPLSTDSVRRWGVGYGLDLVAPYNYTSNFIVQQAYAEVRWLYGALSLGSKEWPMELKNNSLSSGSQTLGINARPVPQVRLSLPDYWPLPFANGWVSMKGHIAYGLLTDTDWQRDFTSCQSKYAEHTRYHSKAGYLKIGRGDELYPWSLELGLEMATLFGGTSYKPDGKGGMQRIDNDNSFSSYWRALVPGGGDVPEHGTVYENVEGDFLGSWVFRLNYNGEEWGMSIYGDHYFEDHSGMFFLDYNGYGEGEEWAKKKKTRFFLYDLKDIMLGAELNFKYRRWLNNVVFEYLYTKYQSGPVYHDHTPSISDHVAGNDNYYNHYVFSGWQHHGQVMGNPLYRSPIYNTDGSIEVQNSRFMAFHMGFSGNPSDLFSYRVLATWQEGLGTYENPYTKPHHNFSYLLEGTCHLSHGWRVRGALGMDFGGILGRNSGFQLTLAKTGLVKRSRRH